MFHALAIVAIGILMSPKLFGSIKLLKIAAICMNLGIVFFSGSLYILALSGISILGAITPIGGVLFLVGWILIIVTTLKINSTQKELREKNLVILFNPLNTRFNFLNLQTNFIFKPVKT